MEGKAGGLSLLAFLSSQAARCYAVLVPIFFAAYIRYALLPVAVATFGHCCLAWSCTGAAAAAACACAAVAAVSTCLRPPPCFLVDYACFKPSSEYKVSMEVGTFFAEDSGLFTEENIDFQKKVLCKSGLGDETYGPPYAFRGKGDLPTLHEARQELYYMMGGAFQQLLAKTGVRPNEIDILITHMCTFNPTPSISSVMVNKYKLREDVKTYHISGMGCAAGVIAIDMANAMFHVHKRKYIVVLGGEGLTLGSYRGNDRSMLLANCLFRAGSYALLLSNRKEDRKKSKMQLLRSMRTTTAADDGSFDCIFLREDDEGQIGAALSEKLLDVATNALALSVPKLIPQFMPLAELLKTAIVFFRHQVLKQYHLAPYLPDFNKAFTHFCIHPGGRLVVEQIGKRLRLSDLNLEASRMALHRFGNTSSSGLWYALAYIEAKNRLKAGDTIWGISLGSGFKCNHAVWRVLSDVPTPCGYNPWLDCIHRYPVPIIPDRPRKKA